MPANAAPNDLITGGLRGSLAPDANVPATVPPSQFVPEPASPDRDRTAGRPQLLWGGFGVVVLLAVSVGAFVLLAQEDGGPEGSDATATTTYVDPGARLPLYAGGPLEDVCDIVIRYLPVAELESLAAGLPSTVSFEPTMATTYFPMEEFNGGNSCSIGSASAGGENAIPAIAIGEGDVSDGHEAIPELGEGVWSGEAGPYWMERGWRFEVHFYGQDVNPMLKDLRLRIALVIHKNIAEEAAD